MIRLTVLLLTLAMPAAATQDAWPALHSVIGVASDDVLNVRVGPSAEAEVIGALKTDATGVEVVRPNDRHTWGLVNLGERSGWVSLSYLRREPGQWLGASIPAAQCFGTEPFWGLSFDDTGTTSWSDPELRRESPLEGRLIGRLSTIAARDVQGISFENADGSAGIVLMTLTGCHDGMSDREYGIRANVVIGGDELYSGCCTLVAPGQ